MCKQISIEFLSIKLLEQLYSALICYCSVLVTINLEGVYRMRAECGGYSPGEGRWLSNYYLCKNIYNLSWLCRLLIS